MKKLLLTLGLLTSGYIFNMQHVTPENAAKALAVTTAVATPELTVLPATYVVAQGTACIAERVASGYQHYLDNSCDEGVSGFLLAAAAIFSAQQAYEHSDPRSLLGTAVLGSLSVIGLNHLANNLSK